MKTYQPRWLNPKGLWFYAAIAICIVILLTLLAAPNNSGLRSGSTFNRDPDGYGAWYRFMEQRGTPMQRWQRPFRDLPRSANSQAPLTLVQVHSSLVAPEPNPQEQNWIKQGNTLVSLGVLLPVTAANFHTLQSSPEGIVKIDTRRRHTQRVEPNKQRLGDRFGAVVWQETLGKGQVIFATTPHLAANAYQDSPGNYQFLAQLVTQNNAPVWVDEYIHGYREAGIQQSTSGNWVTYLAKTPLLPVLCQAGILLLVLIWTENRRLGPPLSPTTPGVNNSKAYIQALADVLYKAESREFILDTVGKAEQQQVQVSLGLGNRLLDHPQLIDVWVRQTGRPALELEQMLRSQSGRRISDADLLIWLKNVETVRRHLSS